MDPFGLSASKSLRCRSSRPRVKDHDRLDTDQHRAACLTSKVGSDYEKVPCLGSLGHLLAPVDVCPDLPGPFAVKMPDIGTHMFIKGVPGIEMA